MPGAHGAHGWFADPHARWPLRYWDGESWTDLVARVDGSSQLETGVDIISRRPPEQDRDLMARRRPRVRLHDADEEVRREECSEEHDLADDEEVHAQRLRVDARREVRRGMPVVLLVVQVGGDAGSFHQAARPSVSELELD